MAKSQTGQSPKDVLDNETLLYAGYTALQLRDAFGSIQNPLDWKGSIRKIVQVKNPSELGVIAASIVFFTGTWPTFTSTNGQGGYCIEAAGYRAGPCGDH